MVRSQQDNYETGVFLGIQLNLRGVGDGWMV